ncbi:muscular LMNA-interacting protein isoform X11 [Hemitrygon akajei]|uniref:muscular LMNA-interacting protein isoform X11 n=1 Tax=Hemitrygon akajei TaxID=2704970 RepID=UPI003BF9EF3A
MVFKKKSHICLDQSTVTVLVSQKINKQENGTLDILETLMNPLLKEKKGQCSVMKSMVRINETAKPLAFTFVPTVRRLPAHIQVMDTRFSHQPGKLQSSMASSSILNEPLCITEEEQSGSFRVEDGIVEGASNRSWLNNEGNFGPAEEASQIQGIFKAEFVLLTDSDGNDSDCFSQGDGVDLSATALSLSSLTPNPFTDDKGSFVHPNVVEDKTKVPFLQDAEQKLDGAVQESLFQYKIKSSYKVFAAIPTNTLLLDQKAIDEAVNDLGETTTQSTSKEMHSQFLYEPGSLRQQSEELYATIEQVLEDPLPSHCTGSSLRSPPRPLDSEAHKPISPIPKSAGRETKYANLHLPSPKTTENQPTRPGVIRPVTALQKVPSMLEVDDICSNPFRQHTDETNNSEIKECLFPLSAILSSVSRPSVCYEMYQTMSCSQDMLQSVPLSLSPVTCLTSGSHIRFSPIAPCNYYMTSNLSRSLHSLYIKPRHSITTIHENEALGNTELPTATEKPNKVLLQRPGTERGSGKLVKDYGGRGREDLETLEKGKERAVK